MSQHKIIITADLHYPMTPADMLRAHAKKISRLKPDIVVIAGDIGETRLSLANVRDALDFYRDIISAKCPILVIPGNHDLWTDHDEYSSLQLWETLLKQETTRAGCLWLEGNYVVRQDIAIVGSYLHYDYSAIDTVGPCSKLPPAWFEKNKGSYNNDGNYMRGLPDDKTFADQIGKVFLDQLHQAQDNPEVNHIVVVTHVACLEEQMCRHPHDANWAMATPYFGNLTYQKAILACDKVRWVVSGHSHKGRKEIIQRGQMEDVQAVSLDADYRKPEHIVVEL